MSGNRPCRQGLLILGALLLTAAEAKKETPRATVFNLPGDVKVLDVKERRFHRGGDYLLRKGADVRLWGSGDCFVESGARVSFIDWNGTIVIQKGGELVELRHTRGARIYYEKGALLPKNLDASISLKEYDRITLKPFPVFTLRGTVREQGRPRARVRICFASPHGHPLGQAISDDKGTFSFRCLRRVGTLVAYLGDRWQDPPRDTGPAAFVARVNTPDALDFERRVQGLHGWETEIREGFWEKDSDVVIERTSRAELDVPAPIVLAAHEQTINQLLFSPDGSLLVTASQIGRPCVWDVKTGKALRRFLLTGFHHLQFDAHGKRLVAVNSSGVHFWDVKSGEQRQPLTAVPNEPCSAALSPDGSTLALGTPEGEIHLHNLNTGKPLVHFKAHVGRIASLCFSRDGGLLLSTAHVPYRRYDFDWQTSDRVRVWDPVSGRAVRTFAVEAQTLVAAPDGELFAGSGGRAKIEKSDRGLRISSDLYFYVWNSRTGQRLLRADEWGDAVGFTADGQLVTAATGRKLRVWETTTGQQVLSCPLPQTRLTSVAFSPDGHTLAVGGEDGRLFLYDVPPHRLYLPADRPWNDADSEQLWTALASDKAAAAYRAVWTLQRHPAPAVALVRRRLRPASETITKSIEELRAVRAIHLLEALASPEATELLRTLTHGASAARQTRAATAALKRLTK